MEGKHSVNADDNHHASGEQPSQELNSGDAIEEKHDVTQLEDVDSEKPEDELWYTKEEADKVIRKLDWHLMPLIFVLYSLSVLDRQVCKSSSARKHH